MARFALKNGAVVDRDIEWLLRRPLMRFIDRVAREVAVDGLIDTYPQHTRHHDYGNISLRGRRPEDSKWTSCSELYREAFLAMLTITCCKRINEFLWEREGAKFAVLDYDQLTPHAGSFHVLALDWDNNEEPYWYRRNYTPLNWPQWVKNKLLIGYPEWLPNEIRWHHA